MKEAWILIVFIVILISVAVCLAISAPINSGDFYNDRSLFCNQYKEWGIGKPTFKTCYEVRL